MEPTKTRTSAPPHRYLGAVLIVAALAAAGCATAHRPGRTARAGEERLEQAAPPAPVVPPPALELLAPNATTARPLDALVRESGAAGDFDASGRRLIYVVDQVRFAPGSAALDAPMRGLLDQLAQRLLADGAADFLEIQGHADATGSSSGNIDLALRRAEAVRSYLVLSGTIPRARTAIVSLGSEHPLGDSTTAAGRAHDRSAVVLILR
jgi:outer membrane protein OmpA-like peptidoglycan-associated protein